MTEVLHPPSRTGERVSKAGLFMLKTKSKKESESYGTEDQKERKENKLYVEG